MSKHKNDLFNTETDAAKDFQKYLEDAANIRATAMAAADTAYEAARQKLQATRDEIEKNAMETYLAADAADVVAGVKEANAKAGLDVKGKPTQVLETIKIAA